MADPTPIRAGEGSYLCRVDLYRAPTGEIRAALVDMPDHVIEARETVTKRFFMLAEWCLTASLDFMRQGIRFDEETRAANDQEATNG